MITTVTQPILKLGPPDFAKWLWLITLYIMPNYPTYYAKFYNSRLGVITQITMPNYPKILCQVPKRLGIAPISLGLIPITLGIIPMVFRWNYPNIGWQNEKGTILIMGHFLFKHYANYISIDSAWKNEQL